MDFLKKLSKYENLEVFLIMELLALASFALGGNNVIFYVAGFILAIFGLLLNFNKFEKNETFSLAVMGIPVLLIAVFVGFGTFYRNENIFTNIFAFLAIISFFALGLFSRRMRKLKIATVLYCIGFGLSLLVLVSIIYSWMSYGFFYSIIYQDTPNYYYNGVIYDITKEAAFLFGFDFKEVTIQYTGFFGFILTSFLSGLLFVSPKKDPKKFAILCFIGFVGVLALISVPNFKAFLFVIPVALLAALLKFYYSPKFKDELKTKVRKIVSIAFTALVAILVIFFVFSFLNATGIGGFNEVVANNEFLRKLFNNGQIMMPINYVLNQSVFEYNLFGFYVSPSYYATQIAANTRTMFFEFEIVKEGGIFALMVLVFLIIMVFSSVQKYSSKGKDKPYEKILIISLMFAIFIYATFSFDAFPFIHESGYNSFFRSLPGLILLFLVGYTYYPDLKKGEIPAFEKDIDEDDKKKDKNEDYSDDYTFTTDEEEKNI